MTLEPARIERALELLGSLVHSDPELALELAASTPEFFGPRGAPREDELAARRQLEWFLLERPSASFDAPPVRELVLRTRSNSRHECIDDELCAALIGSLCGVFEVSSTEPGQGVWLRDLAGGGQLPLVEREASLLLARGDLLCGRLFPLGDQSHCASRTAGVFRDPELLVALRADLERARGSRRGVVRIAQDEIESLFHARTGHRRATRPIDAARAWLLSSGMAAEDGDMLLDELAEEPFEPTHILPGAHDVLGAILDRLAFDTDADLEHGRRLLLAAWEDLSLRGPGQGISLRPMPRGASPSPDKVAAAVTQFASKRARGADVEQALRELEQALELDDEDEPDPELPDPVPDFPGVVAALVEEFLWETGHELGAQTALACESLRSLGRYAVHVGVIDNLATRDLAAYASYWIIDAGELANADDARQLLSALKRFVRWSDLTQQVELERAFAADLHALESALPRLAEANRRRTREAASHEGERWHCLEVNESGSLRLSRTDGRELLASCDAQLAQWLQVGDWLRGSLDERQRLAVYACYPARAAEFLGT